MLGYTREEFARLVVADVEGNDSPEQVREHMQALWRARGGVFETRHRTKDGALHHVRVSARAVTLQGRRVFIAIWSDITGPKKLEATLTATAEFVSRQPSKGYMESLAAFAAATFGADYCHVALVEPDPCRVRTVAAWLDGRLIEPGYVYCLAGTPCENVLGLTRKCYPHDVQSQFPADADLVTLGAESYVGEPILDDRGRPLGLIVLVMRRPLELANGIMAGLRILAARAGADLTRQRAEEAARSSDLRFRTMAEHSADWMWAVDVEGRHTFTNHRGMEILGYDEDHFLEADPTTLIHPDDLPSFCATFAESIATRQGWQNVVLRWRHRDGGYRSLESSASPVIGRNGELLGFQGVDRDITERMRADEALRQSEERHRLISGVTSDLVYSCVRTGGQPYRIDWTTGSVERIFGISAEELMAQGCWRCLVHPEDLPVFDRHVTSLHPGESSECELRVVRRDGSVRHLIAYSRVVAAEDGEEQHRLYGACQDITERKEAEARIEYLAHHDALTGLPNRVLVRDRFGQAQAFAERRKNRVAMLFLDLDNFKVVNDTLGHAAGDRLLQQMVSRLEACVRETDTVSRQGGDEFIVLLTDIPGPEAVERVAAEILRRTAQPVTVDGHELNTACSIGISLYPDDGVDFDTLLQKADTAMYNAKGAGRNTYRFFDEAMNRKARDHLLLQNRLHQALAAGELRLQFQPQIEIPSGRVSGVEALLRWRDPELGEIPPSRFIPVAEDCGLIAPIGEWVLAEACRQGEAWRRAGVPELSVAVNLSALQFRRTNLVDTVIDALDRSGLPPRLLELELTESSLLQDVDTTLDTVRRLKARGVRLAIDDFGTGYSSLSYLRRFAVDRLKIDRSFVGNIGSDADADDAAIVRAIIQLAQSLRLQILAEGVETEEQLGFLLDEGCQAVQGYLFSRPLNPDEVAAFVRARTTPAG